MHGTRPEQIGHALPSFVLLSVVARHSCSWPHFPSRHSHHAFWSLPQVTSSGVVPMLRKGCHCAAMPGAPAARVGCPVPASLLVAT